MWLKFTHSNKASKDWDNRMNAAQRRHYDAIQQIARDEWPVNEQRPEDRAGDELKTAQESKR